MLLCVAQIVKCAGVERALDWRATDRNPDGRKPLARVPSRGTRDRARARRAGCAKRPPSRKHNAKASNKNDFVPNRAFAPNVTCQPAPHRSRHRGARGIPAAQLRARPPGPDRVPRVAHLSPLQCIVCTRAGGTASPASCCTFRQHISWHAHHAGTSIPAGAQVQAGALAAHADQ